MILIRAWRKLVNVCVSFVGTWWLKYLGVRCEHRLTLYGLPVVSVASASRMEVGRNVVLCSSSAHTALGVDHPVVLRTLTPGAELVIGDDVGISGGSICASRRVIIGSRVMLGANVTIADTDFHPISPDNRRYNTDPRRVNTADVIIGENVFIGTNSIVLKGVTIGDNSVIGAGSVVSRDIPPDVIAAGNPCTVVRKLNDQE